MYCKPNYIMLKIIVVIVFPPFPSLGLVFCVTKDNIQLETLNSNTLGLTPWLRISSRCKNTTLPLFFIML